ncbi:Hypothetical protein PACV_409 [Pacmanvirus A23]|uniref:Hypothetical protein n=1 Tax=Pacmanvirus A23 TaxID=1932881 RepID=UPI000A093BC0|nr:Hypothetical protein B9W72_gp405 [Pacmanvirus A23]SIP86122.1 Hypothetical protein PACV_409 [Pacmanvirus A23]
MSGISSSMYDNIDDDFDVEAQLAQFIDEAASSPTSAGESIADLYIKQMQENLGENTSYYRRPSTVISDVSDNIKIIDNAYKTNKTSEYYNNRSRISSYIDYVEDEFDESETNNYTLSDNDMQESIDAVSDRVDKIYDCVRSGDTVLNEMYEKQILLEDTVDRMNMVVKNTNERICELEKSNKQLLIENQAIRNKFDGIATLLRKILEDTRAIRYKDEDD